MLPMVGECLEHLYENEAAITGGLNIQLINLFQN